MGRKISIDSATLMNKGLERIEAMHLFGLPLDNIIVLIQREAKIHSMVEFCDGSVIAQLGTSDMRIPIQYALSYPERWDTPCERVDFRTIGSLSFGAPDTAAFTCLALAGRAGKEGGTMPCVLNAANEVAVDAYLSGACGFNDIERIVEVARSTRMSARMSSHSSSFPRSTHGHVHAPVTSSRPWRKHKTFPPAGRYSFAFGDPSRQGGVVPFLNIEVVEVLCRRSSLL